MALPTRISCPKSSSLVTTQRMSEGVIGIVSELFLTMKTTITRKFSGATDNFLSYILISWFQKSLPLLFSKFLTAPIAPAQSAEWPAAQTGGDPKIRIQREQPAVAFDLGHRHETGVHKIHRRVGVFFHQRQHVSFAESFHVFFVCRKVFDAAAEAAASVAS